MIYGDDRYLVVQLGTMVGMSLDVVWTFYTFEYNNKLEHFFARYLKESCRYRLNEQLSFKCFVDFAFVREISPK